MAARAVSVHPPVLSRIEGARSATMDDQNDGHTVDVAVGQLRVEVDGLELETLDVVVSVVLDDVTTAELDDGSVALEREDDAEEPDVVSGVASAVSVFDVELAVLDVVLGPAPEVELLVLDVDDVVDCTAQDATDGLRPAKYTFRRSGPPHVSAVFPLHGM